MTTHSSTLAWKIPWTEERGRLYSSWSHDLATKQQQNFKGEMELQGGPSEKASMVAFKLGDQQKDPAAGQGGGQRTESSHKKVK